MAKLAHYPNLEEKSAKFNGVSHAGISSALASPFIIDHASEFMDWYKTIKQKQKQEGPYANFFRGASEASHKLFNSAQRYWIQNNLIELESLSQPLTYMEMIQNMVNKAKDVQLLKQVFNYFELTREQQDFPLLSILQHYNAPTPLLDWTYDLDIALYFALTNLKKSEKEKEIGNYISIYLINKVTHASFMKNNLNFISGNVFPSVTGLANYLGTNNIVYISDFEINELKDDRKIKPLTTYYNLNILAQKGIFIFNPHPDKPIEDYCLYPGIPGHDDDRVFCYNINKDLTALIKLVIGREKISEDLLFPDLRSFSTNILNDYLKDVVGH